MAELFCKYLRAVRAEFAFKPKLLVGGDLGLGYELWDGVSGTRRHPPDVAVSLVVDGRHVGRLRVDAYVLDGGVWFRNLKA